ncbi:MAG: pyridoxal phosphate-dependent aminotransferase [Clostridia bacterium]|nr:pyridoxal phosphate-dependent aminotransferase [Clostridia bacterium]MBR6039254.1 pyridoxal phosphate-dependent aminotransferase [Clostridia bacterium]
MKPLRRVVPSSITMSLDKAAKELKASGRDVINLTAGQVDLPMPQSGKDAVIAALNADRTGYVPATGSADVKAAVRNRMGWHEGSILISAGAKPLVSASIACLCGPGDEVLLPTPCYTSYPEMIRLAGAVPVLVPGDPENRFAVSRTTLEQAISPRTNALLLNNPVNPTGTVYRREELRAIADFCKEHDLWLVADEVYGEFVYDGGFVSLYKFADVRDRLILINSASKSYAIAGLRLGYAVTPESAADAIAAYLSHTLGCPCSLSERAAIAVLDDDARFCRDLREIFRERRNTLYPLLTSIPGIRVEQSAGAFYLWLYVRETGMDDTAFCRDLLEREGVALTPGSAFLCPGFVRLAYTQPEPVLRKAAERLARFVSHPGSRNERR